jgi:hypothetical protein
VFDAKKGWWGGSSRLSPDRLLLPEVGRRYGEVHQPDLFDTEVQVEVDFTPRHDA